MLLVLKLRLLQKLPTEMNLLERKTLRAKITQIMSLLMNLPMIPDIADLMMDTDLFVVPKVTDFQEVRNKELLLLVLLSMIQSS